MMCME